MAWNTSQRRKDYICGQASMGSLTDREVGGRTKWAEPRQLSSVRVHFEGGSGTATVYMYRQKWLDKPNRNFELHSWPTRGINADAMLELNEEESSHFIFEIDEECVLVWADPSSGATTWTIEITSYPAPNGYTS